MQFEDERLAVVGACRDLVATGLVRGTSGNISVRDAATGLVVISPSGAAYATMTASEVAVMTLGGEVVDGALEPTSEASLHLGIYRARDDLLAVVHTHSPYATTFAALGEPVPAVHYILAKAATSVRVTPYRRYGTQELADVCVDTLGDDFGVLLGNHGVVAVGANLAAAMSVAEAIEFTAEIAWRAKTVGLANVLSPDEMDGVRTAFSSYGRALR